MIVKTQREQMIDNLKTLVAFVKEPKVIKCSNPIGLDFEDSDKPNLIILDGTVKKEDFELAKELIEVGGVIAFTRGNAGISNSMKEAEELYGDSWLIAVDAINAGEYIGNIRNILVYVKGASKEYDKKGNDWATFKSNYKVIQMHNFKAAYKNMSFLKGGTEDTVKEIEIGALDNSEKVIEPAPKKRKRRTKAEIEADKAKDNEKENS